MTEEKPVRKAPTKKAKAAPARAFTSEKLEEGDWPEKEASEGAPETETPEEPKSPPKGVRRDDAAPMETPEKPAVRQRPLPKAPDTQVVAELAASAPTVEDPYVASLFQHVATHPVDAHAPVWVARTPNTTGGYS